MKVINIASNYPSKYAGNFIHSLLALAKKLKNNCKYIFLFRSNSLSYLILGFLHFWLAALISNIDGTRWAYNFRTRLFYLGGSTELRKFIGNKITDKKSMKNMQTELAESFSILKRVNEVSSIIECCF